jgi:hypothetical protein
MNKIQPKYFRILAIAPSTRGFGFAVLEGEASLVDWGVKTAKGDKNKQSLAKVEKLAYLSCPRYHDDSKFHCRGMNSIACSFRIETGYAG